MATPTAPQARTEGLVVKALPDEVLVHDLARHRTHCLNGSAAAVWRLCDGQRTPAEIARQLGRALEPRWTEEAVRLALDQLSRARLLTEPRPLPTAAGGVTRRQTLQRLAAAVVVVPTVTTIVAPRAAQAQSGSPPQQQCIPSGGSCNPSGGPPCCDPNDGCFEIGSNPPVCTD